MKIYVSSKKFLIGMFAILVMGIFGIINVCFNDISIDSIKWSSSITPLILLLLLTELFFLKLLLPKKRVIMYIVTLIFFIFNFSHVILQGMEYDFGTNTRNNVFFRQSFASIIQATHIGIEASIGLFIGYVLFFVFYKKKNLQRERFHIEQKKKLLAYFLVFIGFAADILVSGSTIIALLTGSYAEVQETLSSSFYGIKILSYLLLPGVLIFLQDRKTSERRRKTLVVVFIIYKILMMLSGLRAYSLINILIILYVYYRTYKKQKVTPKHIILALLVLQIGGGMLVGIREARTSGMNIETIISYMFNLKANILFNMMSEFGITQNVLCLVQDSVEGFGNKGMQLLYSFIIMIPGISTIAPNLDYKNAFLEDTLNIHNYGGTYVGDILFDFGRDGLLLGCIVLGILFAALYEWFERNIEEGNTLSVAIAAPVITELIFSVRSSLAKMPRMVSWYLAVIIFLVLFTKSVRRGEKSSQPAKLSSDSAKIEKGNRPD